MRPIAWLIEWRDGKLVWLDTYVCHTRDQARRRLKGTFADGFGPMHARIVKYVAEESK